MDPILFVYNKVCLPFDSKKKSIIKLEWKLKDDAGNIKWGKIVKRRVSGESTYKIKNYQQNVPLRIKVIS